MKKGITINSLAAFTGIVLLCTAILGLFGLQKWAWWFILGSCILGYLGFVIKTVVRHTKEVRKSPPVKKVKNKSKSRRK